MAGRVTWGQPVERRRGHGCLERTASGPERAFTAQNPSGSTGSCPVLPSCRGCRGCRVAAVLPSACAKVAHDAAPSHLQVGFFVHVYPHTSVQSFHLHIVDLDVTGPTYEVLYALLLTLNLTLTLTLTLTR